MISSLLLPCCLPTARELVAPISCLHSDSSSSPSSSTSCCRISSSNCSFTRAAAMGDVSCRTRRVILLATTVATAIASSLSAGLRDARAEIPSFMLLSASATSSSGSAGSSLDTIDLTSVHCWGVSRPSSLTYFASRSCRYACWASTPAELPARFNLRSKLLVVTVKIAISSSCSSREADGVTESRATSTCCLICEIALLMPSPTRAGRERDVLSWTLGQIPCERTGEVNMVRG
mmetsp:Transcript_15075/g.50909  ORF Transcript_15075/g.50909 Transcript_15075/m.50909 type:complete len:234 (+) Transcript_15075:906-1607(+)